jgi:hypothetical protein
MKNQEQDQLAEFIREAKPLSPSADFTELLMEQIDPAFSLEQEELTVGLRNERKELRLSPSMDFSDELMERLSGPRVSKRIYGAVRPRRVWTGVGDDRFFIDRVGFYSGIRAHANDDVVTRPDCFAQLVRSG